MVTYRAGLADSSRWEQVRLRAGDIVISVPSKCGTTWLQMICALLVFQRADLPAPLTVLSPWVDMRLEDVGDMARRLDRQRHRRFLKTHTPLDGLPRVDGVSYLVAGRDPRDVAVSMDHHRANLDQARIGQLIRASGAAAPEARPAAPADARLRVLRWIEDDRSPVESVDTLRGLLHHVGQAWAERDGAVILTHHADLRRDLDGEMRRLADRLGITLDERRWPDLVAAATFEAMRARADQLVPDERLAIFHSNSGFFRSGRDGQWRDLLTAADLTRYDQRVGELAPPDLAAWLHR